MEQKNKKQNNYVAPVVKVVAFQIEKGFAGSPEGSNTPLWMNESNSNESYTNGSDVDGNYFGTAF